MTRIYFLSKCVTIKMYKQPLLINQLHVAIVLNNTTQTQSLVCIYKWYHMKMPEPLISCHNDIDINCCHLLFKDFSMESITTRL